MTPDTFPGKGGREGARRPHQLQREVAVGLRPTITLPNGQMARAISVGVPDLQALSDLGQQLIIQPHDDGTTTLRRESAKVSPARRRIEAVVSGATGVKEERRRVLADYKALTRWIHLIIETGQDKPKGIHFSDELLVNEKIGPIIQRAMGGGFAVDTDLATLIECDRGLATSLPRDVLDSLPSELSPNFLLTTEGGS